MSKGKTYRTQVINLHPIKFSDHVFFIILFCGQLTKQAQYPIIYQSLYNKIACSDKFGFQRVTAGTKNHYFYKYYMWLCGGYYGKQNKNQSI